MPEKESILKKYWAILKDAGNGFSQDKAIKLSGSLAYSTIFSLPPMLLLIIILGGYVYGKDALQGTIFTELNDLIGAKAALQVQDIIKGLHYQKSSSLATLVSIIALIVGATGIFVEIQDSLNMIWGVRPKSKKGFIKLLLNRLISFSMILGLGFLLIVSLMINTLIVALSREIAALFPSLSVNLFNIANTVIIFFVLSVLFSVIFKMLPDIRIQWKQVWPGAIVTTCLFLVGKFVIGLYIGHNSTVSLYGAASSLIILLLWIYFSAFILYFGAEFTRAYCEYHGKKIIPNSYAEYNNKRLWKEYEKALKLEAEDGTAPDNGEI